MLDRRNFLLATAGSLTALDLFSSIDKGFTKQLEKNLNKLENYN